METGGSLLKRSAGAPVWLVTFADLMSLLFAMFVLILSFSEVDSDSFRKNAGPIAEAFNQKIPVFRNDTPKSSTTKPVEPQDRVVRLQFQKSGESSDYLKQVARGKLAKTLQDYLSKEIKTNLLTLEIKENFIIMRFPGKTTFAGGSAELTSLIVSTIDRVADVLSRTEGEIFVSGHTDDIPISTSRFRSNWDLSSARAVSVVHRLLRHQGLSGGRISAVGLADTRPLVANEGSYNRIKNRRVEIKVEIPTVRQKN